MSNLIRVVSQKNEEKIEIQDPVVTEVHSKSLEFDKEKNEDSAKKETSENENSSSSCEEEKIEKPEDITGDRGVMKEIIKNGSGWERPKIGSEVSVHYVGTLIDGTKFDSSRDRNEFFKFKLGEGQVIKGWEKVIETMKKGEICKVTLKPEYAYGKSGSPPKIPENATLIFEIELISWEEEKDLSDDGGILKKVLKEGEKWDTPNYEAKCTVNLVTKGPNGEIFENYELKQIIIGNEIFTTQGLEKSLQSMKKGEHSRIKVKSKYAYGNEGNEKLKIPPNTDIVYEITLLDFEKGKQSWELNTFEEKYEVAIRRKNEGNNFFNSQLFQLALNKYENSLSIFKYPSEDMKKLHLKEIDTLNIDCYLNKAAVELKLNNFKNVIENTTKVLEIDSGNVKALWRRGIANSKNGDWVAAKRDFEKALEIDPENKSVKSSMLELKKKIAEEDKKDRIRYQNLFQKLAEQEEKLKSQVKPSNKPQKKIPTHSKNSSKSELVEKQISENYTEEVESHP